MSFLTYFGDERVDVVPPRRVYARVDSSERQPEARDRGRLVLFDSIDADWLDERARGLRWLGAAEVAEEVDERISVVEARLDGGRRSEAFREGEWIEIVFGDDGYQVAHYMNLYAAPLIRAVAELSTVAPDLSERLDGITGLGDLLDAEEDELRRTLCLHAATEAVAVYDVGQGNCNALLENGLPSLYFDFGGGVMGNVSTFPAALQRFCFSHDPLIVLSHWDWDHWSSANRDTRALDATWIVPRQNGRFGPVHTAFLGRINARGRVLAWPDWLSSISVGGVTIERCTGRASSRNESGLALVVEGSDGARMLLPADCGYDHVPSAGGTFRSIVVPHHGGRASSKSVPRSDGDASGRCVYSYGDPNVDHHPRAEVEHTHHAAWPLELRTRSRNHAGLGHVHLYWDSQQPDAHPPCGGAMCQLPCDQR